MKANNLLAKENLELLKKNEELTKRNKELERLNTRYAHISADAETSVEKAYEREQQALKRSAENGQKVDCLRSFFYRAVKLEREVEVCGVYGGKVKLITSPKIRISSRGCSSDFLHTETVECIEF